MLCTGHAFHVCTQLHTGPDAHRNSPGADEQEKAPPPARAWAGPRAGRKRVWREAAWGPEGAPRKAAHPLPHVSRSNRGCWAGPESLASSSGFSHSSLRADAARPLGSSWRLIWRWGRRLVLSSPPPPPGIMVAEGSSTLVDDKGGRGHPWKRAAWAGGRRPARSRPGRGAWLSGAASAGTCVPGGEGGREVHRLARRSRLNTPGPGMS